MSKEREPGFHSWPGPPDKPCVCGCLPSEHGFDTDNSMLAGWWSALTYEPSPTYVSCHHDAPPDSLTL